MNTKILFILPIILIFSIKCYGQTKVQPDHHPPQIATRAYVNQSKYWFYRNRLINEFMKVGPLPGESTPMASIKLNPFDFSIENNPVASSLKIYNSAYGGDGMLRSGGYYIGVLATEYHILKNSGQDCSKTLEELYYALNAIKRLDETAETYDFCNTSNSHPPQLQCLATGPSWNGFLIRDDFDCGLNSSITRYFKNKLDNKFLFIESEACMNLYKKTSLDPFGSGEDASDHVTNNDVSNDQISFLTVGLALVQKFLDGSETYNGVQLKGFAFQIGYKILGHMAQGAPVTAANCQAIEATIGLNCGKEPPLNDQDKKLCDFLGLLDVVLAPEICTKDYIQHNGRYPWLIENPVTSQASCITINGAGYPGFMSGGFAPAINQLTGRNYYVAKKFSDLWDFFKVGSLTDFYNVSTNSLSNANGLQILTQAAIGDSWNTCAAKPVSKVKVCLVGLVPGIGVTAGCALGFNVPVPTVPPGKNGCPFGIKLYDTKKVLDKQAVKGHYEVLALLHNVLYDKTGYEEGALYTFFDKMIDAAPSVGPYCYSGNDGNADHKMRFAAPYGWASTYLIDKASGGDNNVWYSGDDEQKFQGEYNGLDYMLMYNLQTIYNKNYNYYKNYDDNLLIAYRVISHQEYYNARSYFDRFDNDKLVNGKVVMNHVAVVSDPGNQDILPTILDVRAGDFIHLKQVALKPDKNNDKSQVHLYTYQPAKNWDWEMTLSSHFNGTTNRPDGFRMGTSLTEEDNTSYTPSSYNQADMPVTELRNNIPNPTTGITRIPYIISTPGDVELTISDLYGKEISKPVSTKNHEVGYFETELDVSLFMPGVYLYTLKAPGYAASKRMVVVK